jgi:hypothetical protein
MFAFKGGIQGGSEHACVRAAGERTDRSQPDKQTADRARGGESGCTAELDGATAAQDDIECARCRTGRRCVRNLPDRRSPLVCRKEGGVI